MFFDDDKVTKESFINPSNIYRSFPFWSWNDKLEISELERQIEIFKSMGMGGFHMHPRDGFGTIYFSDDFNNCVKACVEKAKILGMIPCLYDEDKWPSGFAGGFVTKNKKYRQRYLHFTKEEKLCNPIYEDGILVDGIKLLGTYYVELSNGRLSSYSFESFNHSHKIYAYLELSKPSAEFDGQTYVDVLNKEAIDCFIDLTLNNYEKFLKDDFGKTIKSIFTDEPQMKRVRNRNKNSYDIDGIIPWTDKFEELYKNRYNESLLEYLPELFFDLSEGYSKHRLQYNVFRTDLFKDCFTSNFGKRCKDLGISLTGHMDNEPSLGSQYESIGEAMIHYPYFGIPGMDLLCGRHEFTTIKQVSSVCNQLEKDGLLCECNGVSRWSVDFDKFIEEGSWLAALGVNIRVPHLSHYTLKGGGKRDYPPTINYQIPWYKEFKIIEDYISRLNLCLTKGKRIIDIGVIHPMESYFLTNDDNYDKSFLRFTETMLYNNLDFDFIAESLIPDLSNKSDTLIGKSKYKVIVLPKLITIRQTTLDYLNRFIKDGGKVIVLDCLPSYIDGIINTPKLDNCLIIPFEEDDIIDSLKEYRLVEFYNNDTYSKNYVINYREDVNNNWLYISRPFKKFIHPMSTPVVHNPQIECEDITIKIKGIWYIERYDPMTGNISNFYVRHENGYTFINNTFYNNDSLLLKLNVEGINGTLYNEDILYKNEVNYSDNVTYELKEENCLLLDRAKVLLDNHYSKELDTFKLTTFYRDYLHLEPYQYKLPPWMLVGKIREFNIHLRYTVRSLLDTDVYFVSENNDFTLSINKENIQLKDSGNYVDLAFRKYPIHIKKGINYIDVTMPFGLNDYIENCYLIGNFGVKLNNVHQTICNLPKILEYKDITKYNMPFYSGSIIYKTTFNTSKDNCEISIPKFNSALLKVYVDGICKNIISSPFTASFNCGKGTHTLEIECFASRENAFGAIHIKKGKKLSDSNKWFFGQVKKYVINGYGLVSNGILDKPIIKEY